MSKKYSYTTADYLPWDTMLTLVRRLYRDGDYRMSLLIGCGCFFGLRFSDLRTLRWEQVLSKDGTFALYEQKTGKRREIKINKGFQQHARDCWRALGSVDLSQPCFTSKYGTVLTSQMVQNLRPPGRGYGGLGRRNGFHQTLRAIQPFQPDGNAPLLGTPARGTRRGVRFIAILT